MSAFLPQAKHPDLSLDISGPFTLVGVYLVSAVRLVQQVNAFP